MIYTNSTKIIKISSLVLSLISFFYFDLFLFTISILIGWLLYGIVAGGILHRGLSHRCFIFRNRFTEYLSCLLIVISGQGSPIGWVAIHRSHHTKTDKTGDPQSPHVVGKINTLLSWYDASLINLSLVKDLLKMPSILFTHKHYGLLFFVYTLLLTIINPVFVFYFAGLSVTICALLVGIFNVIAHGDKLNPDGHYARNLPISLIFFGEENHYKHHKNPNLARLNKVDLCYIIMHIIAKPKSLSL